MRLSMTWFVRIAAILLLVPIAPLAWAQSTPSMLDQTVTQVAAGANHTCVLTTAGAVLCWGGSIPLPSAVSGLSSGVVAIAAGYDHDCALTMVGGVQCWGNNSNGQLGNGSTTSSTLPVTVSGLSSGVVAIAAAVYHTCALTMAGGVQCWGGNASGELGNNTTTTSLVPVAVNGLSGGVVAITAGGAHTCAVTTAGAALCWGEGGAGSLGNNSRTSSSVPVQVSGLSSGVAAIAAGNDGTCALTMNGGVQCWGLNGYGELGNNSLTDSLVPVEVIGLSSGVVAISAGNYHNCALTTAGGVQCWGSNDYGQLGNNSTAESLVPVPVSGLSSGVAAISTGTDTGAFDTCALTTTGGVQCWGNGSAYGSTTNHSVPVTVVGFSTAVAYATRSVTFFDSSTFAEPVGTLVSGLQHTCAVTTAGGAQCWGLNTYGELGNGSTTNSPAPIPVTGLSSGVAALAARNEHTCALTTAGGVQCWGHNNYGQLGNNSTLDSSVPVVVSNLSSGVAAIAVGTNHSCALTTGGAVQCWGAGGGGQLGNNSTANSPIPVTVNTNNILAITSGDSHNCALAFSGGVQCWGLNNDGQLGNNSTMNSSGPVDVIGLSSGVLAIAAGYYHTCALTTANTVLCWGDNNHGQLGNNSTTNSLVPVAVSGLSNVVAIAAGLYHTCALTSAGAAFCWGDNSSGMLGNNSFTDSHVPVAVSGLSSGIAAIAPGFYSTCALATAGGIQCWGGNYNGQFGDGTTTGSPVPVAILSGQSIGFTPPAALPPLTTLSLGSAMNLTATATGAGSVSLVYDTWTPGTCTVGGSTVTATATSGLCGVRVSRAGGSDGANGTTASAPQQLRLLQIGPAMPTLSLSSSVNPSAPGAGVTFTATLASSYQPTGNVYFCADATTTDAACDGGTWLCTIPANSTPIACSTSTLTAGAHAITAYFAGDANNNAATTASALTQLVGIAPAITSGNAATFTVTQSGSFGVTTTGSPTPALSLGAGDTLPNGVSFTDNGNGTATLAGAPALGGVGTYTLHVTAHNIIAPDATQTVTLTVQEATPVLAWPQPTAIIYGTQLSATQLNATATFNGSPVAGTFAYTPPAGTVLNPGTQTLSATFTPNDTTDFATPAAAITTTIMVDKAQLSLSVDDRHQYARYGMTLDYVVTLTNSGNATAHATVAASTPGTGLDFANTLWQCINGGGGTICADNLVKGPFSDTVTLPAGLNVSWIVDVPVATTTSDTTVEFDVSETGDANAASASHTDTLVIFRDGFNVPNGDGTGN